MSREIELKYTMPENLSPDEVLAYINPSAIKEIAMKSTYFDTPNNFLGKMKASLRHRMENGVSVFTIKTAISGNGALAQRGEWQVEAESLEEALPLLTDLGAPKAVVALAQEELVIIAQFEFLRKSAVLRGENYTADFCVDIGYLSPDGVKKSPLREIELELIDGDLNSLCDFGRALSKQLSLVPQRLSKLSRARNLK